MNLLTPGKIADLCGVAPRTVCKWIDNGTLKGFLIPGSRHRRVRREDFEAFQRTYGNQDMAKVEIIEVIEHVTRDDLTRDLSALKAALRRSETEVARLGAINDQLQRENDVLRQLNPSS